MAQIIRKFSDEDAQVMRIEMKEALEKIAKKYNAEITVGNIRYGYNLTAKISFDKITANEHGSYTSTKESREFIDRAESIGFRSDILNEKLNYEGSEIVILGYNTRAKRYPIIFSKDGKMFNSDIGHIFSIVKKVKPEYALW